MQRSYEGNLTIITEWAEEQAGSSHDTMPLVFKWILGEARTVPLGNYYWQDGAPPNKARTIHDISPYSLSTVSETIAIFHAFTQLILNHVAFRFNNSSQKVVRLLRNVGQSSVRRSTELYDDWYTTKHAVYESAAIFAEYDSSDPLMVQYVPYHRIFAVYLGERRPGDTTAASGHTFFLNDKENEFIMMAEGIPFKWVLTRGNDRIDLRGDLSFDREYMHFLVSRHAKEGLSLFDPLAIQRLLIKALRKQDTETTRHLIDAGANVHRQKSDSKTPLMLVLTFDNPDKALVESIIKGIRGDKVKYIDLQDGQGNTALMLAIKKGNEDIAKFLIEEGASVDIQNDNEETALMLASRQYRPDKALVKSIIKGISGDKVEYIDRQNRQGNTALMLAIKKGNEDIAEFLIGEDASVDIQNDNEETALMLAIKKGNEDIAEFLIEEGASVNTQNDNKGTALILASEQYRPDRALVESIIKSIKGDKAKYIDWQDEQGYTALMAAIGMGSRKSNAIAKFLINEGASVNIQNNNDDTALILALNHYRPDEALVELIVKNIKGNKAEYIRLENREGDTALDAAPPFKKILDQAIQQEAISQ